MTKHVWFFLYPFLLLCCLLFPESGMAQKTVRIVGTVVDEYDKPIELAMVRVEKQTALTLTDGKGKYKLTCTQADSLTLVCSMIGYRTRKHVVFHPTDSMVVNLKISSTGVQLGEAEVRALKRKTTTMESINPGKLSFMPSTTGNGVEELVATQMGVSTHNELSAQYNVRGGSFDENSVYINGVEVYRPLLVRSGQQEGLSIINSDMVSNINFSAGGFSARYGDRMSSVLDITYKRPEKLEATLAGSMLGGDLYVGFGNKKFSMMNGLRYKTTRYLISGLSGTNAEYDPNFLDYQNYTSWRPNKRWTIDFIGNISDNHYKFVPHDREVSFGTMNDAKKFIVYFDGQEKDLFRTYFFSLNLTHHFTPKTDLSLLTSYYTTKEQETYDIQGQYWLNQATTQQELGVGTYLEHGRNFLTAKVMTSTLQAHHAFGSHSLLGAFTLKSERLKENSTEWEMRDSSGYSLPHYEDRLNLIYNLRARTSLNTTRMESFIEDTWRFQRSAGLFTLVYGVRLSHWSWNSETLVSPRLSLGFIPAADERFTFRFATGIYYQAPFYKELRDTVTTSGNTAVVLNRDIKSQRSIHFLLGADYQFRLADRPFRFSTELYYKALSNLIPYNVNNLRIVYYGENMGSGYATGIDFKLFGEFVPGTDSWVTLSLMSTKEKINGHSIPRPTDQRYNISLFFTDYFPGTDRWKMTLKGALAGGLPFGAPHSGLEHSSFRAPAYRRVDLGMSYRLYSRNGRKPRSGWGSLLSTAWVGIDAFNVFGLSNVNSYYWVTDITSRQYAVPNYLTGRRVNFRFLLEF